MSIFLIYTYYLPILILILNLGQLVLIYVSAYKIQDTLFSKSGGHDTTFIISTYTINTSASIKLFIDLQGFYMYGSSSFYMYR
jgi:hypothetical protein